MQLPVVALAAADREGLTARRLRIHHLRGSTALAHEPDVVILLNDKSIAVSKAHLAYDPVRADRYRQQVVFSIEKNRSGPAPVDLEFRKDFASFRFHPEGAFLTEKLVDDVLYDQ
jgi:replicative DNA helicase